MAMNKTISIVTPTYNEKDNLLPLIESIAKIMGSQRYEYEHIVIDNCSTDGTKELLKEIAPSRPKLKVIYQNPIISDQNFPRHLRVLILKFRTTAIPQASEKTVW